MNPGTTLFIIIGVIGLLLYISKALKPSLYENFTTLGKDDVSNKVTWTTFPLLICEPHSFLFRAIRYRQPH